MKITKVSLSILLTTVGLFLSLFVAIENVYAGKNPVCALSLQTSQEEVPLNVVSTLGYSWFDFDGYPSFNFKDWNRVLFLSDGGKGGNLNASENKTIFVSTDYSSTRGIQLRLDNNNLPFRPASFDLIIMNRGLCPCHSQTKTCGGLTLDAAEIKKFLINVSKTLNPTSQNALAILTGFYFPGELGSRVPQLFISQLDDLRSTFPEFDYTYLSDPYLNHANGFIGIAISVKGTSLKDNLKSLLTK